MILSMISRAITPGDLPAPDNAWREVIKTISRPYSFMIGFSVMTSPVVVQFGSGAMNPFHPLFFLWMFNNSACSSFIPGIKIGTSSSYLKPAAVLITGTNFANCGSITFASSDSKAVNIISNLSGRISSTLLTMTSLIYSGIVSLFCQRKIPEFGSRSASTYFLPADRSDDTISVNSNHGCLFSARTNCCPTTPVAPIRATFSIEPIIDMQLITVFRIVTYRTCNIFTEDIYDNMQIGMVTNGRSDQVIEKL